ncbi:MAG: 2-dehydro-3-deoxy-6-phosphogalactonate aldolase [Gammaproteobacteria bacterium]|nr:2-dehydro-3-deoxy-6-phosphogalactonate aldolase [Gammaproteobacteria bacterium]
MPLVAVLRGITPEQAVDVGQVLVGAGFTIIEVPLNSPDALESIRLLSAAFSDRALTGAGTVLSVKDAEDIAAVGGNLIVMPHSDPEVIRAAKNLGCIVMPGVMTPTEAFAALNNGADALKLFPAEVISPAALKAMRAVLPRETVLLPVGGINPDNMADYWASGASGFGLGSNLFKPGKPLQAIEKDALDCVNSINRLKAQ